MREPYPSYEISSEQSSHSYPESEESLAVQQSPSVGEVSHREELQGKRQLHEAEGHLDHIHPVAALRSRVQHLREEGKESERQSQCEREAEHADDRPHQARCHHLHKKESDDRACAGEAHQHERECHKEDTEQTCSAVSLAVHSRIPLRGQRDLKASDERNAEEHKHEEEYDVEDSVGSQVIESRRTKSRRYDYAESHIDDHDAHTIEHGVAYAPLLGSRLLLFCRLASSAPLQEERHSHRDDRPHTRSHQRNESSHKSEDEDSPERRVSRIAVSSLVKCLQLVNDRRPDAFSWFGASHIGLSSHSVSSFSCLLGNVDLLSLCIFSLCFCRRRFCLLLTLRLLFLSLRHRSLAVKLEVHGSRRNAVLVVASTIFEVALYLILAAEQLHLLGESGSVLEEVHVRAEHVLIFLYGSF